MWPTTITQAELDKMNLIPDTEVEQDIRDTEREIANMTLELQGQELIAKANIAEPRGRMAHFRAGGIRQGITERQQFVIFLNLLLAARKGVP